MTIFRWLDGRAIPPVDLASGQTRNAMRVPIPRGYRLGEGIYETLLAAARRRGLPSTWPRHRARFRRGAAQMGLPWPGDQEVDRQLFAALHILRGGISPAEPSVRWWRVRLTLAATGPDSPFAAPDQASLWIDAQAAVRRVRPPARLCVGPRLRNPADPLSGTKRITLASDLHALRAAQASGFDDVVLRDTAGRLSEATTSALLVGLPSGGVGSPAADTAPLPSTTLALFAASGHAVQPLHWQIDDAAQATWAVLLNAVQGGRPVVCIGEHRLEPPPARVVASLRRLVDDGDDGDDGAVTNGALDP